MTYAVGETVVYPNHGAAQIEAIETRQVNGQDKTYLVLRIASRKELVVRVPTCSLDLVGVREIVDAEGLKLVLEVLRAESAESAESSNWSRRRRANAEKVRSGSVISVAEVVRDLGRRQRAGHLSAAEGHMLANAREILVSELVSCGQADQEQAQTLLDEVLGAEDAVTQRAC